VLLNTKHIDKLFEVVDLQDTWFRLYHPDVKPPIHFLLKVQHYRLIEYLLIEKLGEYTNEDIDNKLDKSINAYLDLFELSNKNKKS